MTMIEAFKQAFIEEGVPQDQLEKLMKTNPHKMPKKAAERVIEEGKEREMIMFFRGMVISMMHTAEKLYGKKKGNIL